MVGQFDADVVRLMKRAGAIILAVTNVSGACQFISTCCNFKRVLYIQLVHRTVHVVGEQQ